MRKLGVLGGTFDPIHIGHLAIAQTALEKYRLDKVLFIPSCLPPHKKVPHLASAEDRLRMVKLAVAGNPGFEASALEVQRGGKSFTVDTLRELHRRYSASTKIYFIVGEDSLPDLPAWRDIDEILSLASLIVVNRPGFKKGRGPVPHLSAPMPGVEISSSALRACLRQGKSIKYLVPEKVFEYIKQRKLYKKGH